MLASLELFGFKSFAERTTFDFAAGVTAVVGPNGSGKSNVVDAIKWVLGDQSAKSLRGKEMTDVIFNGAAGRKPGNLAEATLTFDNRERFLPADEDYVRVGRRLWRNGDSEYLLGGQVARLKDVRDLFMGTGAGSSAYAIIEQGRVDQLLQANAIGRRTVFEEAAGISRYKAKKNDALRRLERVEQNLLRLTDIADEVEARLGATRTQAAKAAAHRDATRTLERWWLGLAADDVRQHAAELKTLRAAVAEHQAELDAVDQQQSSLAEQAAESEGELAAAQNTLRDAERNAATTREAIAGHEAAREYQSARLREVSQELPRLRRQSARLTARATEGEREKAHSTEILAATEREVEERRGRLDRREAERERFTEDNETLGTRITQECGRHQTLVHEAAEAERQIAALSAERDSLGTAGQAIAKELEARLAELAASEQERNLAQSAVAEAEATVRSRQGRAADLRAARQRLAAEREEIAGQIARLRERKSATTARITVLEDLQQRGEGFGIGVREILRRARSLGEAPWNQIHGTVAELLDVDLDDAPLLEIALGHRAELVVIENFDALLPYLGRASAKIAGRVGFLSDEDVSQSVENDLSGVRYLEANPRLAMNSPDPPTANEGSPHERHDPKSPRAGHPSLWGLPGVIRRADDVVRSTSPMPHLAERLLYDTWIVSDLPTALGLAAGHGRGQRFVTQSGELLDADRTLVVGTLRTAAAVVSRRSELAQLRRERIEQERAIAEVQEQRSMREASHSSLTETLGRAESELREAIDWQNRARSLCERKASRWQQHDDDRQRLESQLRSQEQSLSKLDERIAAAGDHHLELRDETTRLDSEIAQLRDTLTTFQQEQSECEGSSTAERLALAKAEERLTALRESVARWDHDLDQRAGQRDEAERRLEAALNQQRQAACHLLNTRAQHAESYCLRERHEQCVRQRTAGRDALRKERAEWSRRESELAASRRTARDALHEAELAIRERDHKLTALAERIREEYNRELSDLEVSEHSAIPLWVAERKGEPDADGQPSEEEEPASFTIPPYGEIRPEIAARVERLRKKLRLMGAVNVESLADLEGLEERHEQLTRQLQDLIEAKRTLEDVIRRINTESQRMFLETFESIRAHFQELFRKLFGGGEGDILLEDAADVLDCGIDIVARPPGKELRSLSLLSGGEKTMTCVALLLAIFRSKPSPFCLLDEVDAALDEANIGRFVGVLKEFKSSTQFIMITHRKPSMCEADLLYGVTMEQAGVSKRLNVRFDDIGEDGNFKTARRRKAA